MPDREWQPWIVLWPINGWHMNRGDKTTIQSFTCPILNLLVIQIQLYPRGRDDAGWAYLTFGVSWERPSQVRWPPSYIDPGRIHCLQTPIKSPEGMSDSILSKYPLYLLIPFLVSNGQDMLTLDCTEALFTKWYWVLAAPSSDFPTPSRYRF